MIYLDVFQIIYLRVYLGTFGYLFELFFGVSLSMFWYFLPSFWPISGYLWVSFGIFGYLSVSFGIFLNHFRVSLGIFGYLSVSFGIFLIHFRVSLGIFRYLLVSLGIFWYLLVSFSIFWYLLVSFGIFSLLLIFFWCFFIIFFFFSKHVLIHHLMNFSWIFILKNIIALIQRLREPLVLIFLFVRFFTLEIHGHKKKHRKNITDLIQRLIEPLFESSNHISEKVFFSDPCVLQTSGKLEPKSPLFLRFDLKNVQLTQPRILLELVLKYDKPEELMLLHCAVCNLHMVKVKDPS